MIYLKRFIFIFLSIVILILTGVFYFCCIVLLPLISICLYIFTGYIDIEIDAPARWVVSILEKLEPK